MIDLHSHILAGIDDGAVDLAASVAMARAFVDDGVSVLACTPHILPGLYQNTGPQIRAAVKVLQAELDHRGIGLSLVTGADNHVVGDFVSGLQRGHLLTLADSRYVLVEPPHHVVPPRLEELFFDIQAAGYVPILTHPERLSWIKTNYAIVERLCDSGAWMQITAGSLLGAFGKSAQYWAERMLDEARVHILATDAHDINRRPPNLAAGREAAALRVGADEAEKLVVTRPRGVLANVAPSSLPPPCSAGAPAIFEATGTSHAPRERMAAAAAHRDGLARRLWRIFE